MPDHEAIPPAESSRLPFGTRIVVAAFFVQAVAIGMTLVAFPVFMAAVENEFGVSRTVMSLGIPALLVSGALLAPWIGRRIDVGSPRTVMIAGALLIGAGYAGLAWSPSFLWATAFWVLAVGSGQTMLGPLPATTVLARWFVRRRGTAIAIAATGTTFGGALMPPVVERLIGAYGWREAVLVLGVVAVMIAIPAVVFGIVKSPEDVGNYPDGDPSPPAEEMLPDGDGSPGAIVRDPRFWRVGATFGIMSSASIAFITHLLYIAAERGIPREEAVVALTINALSTLSGKLIFGVLLDRVGVQKATLIGSGVQLIGWLLMMTATGMPAFLVSAGIFSVGIGCAMPCQAAYVAEVFGRGRFGQASGLVGLVMLSGSLVVAPAVGAAYEALGSYDVPLRVLAVLLLLPLGLIASIRRR